MGLPLTDQPASRLQLTKPSQCSLQGTTARSLAFVVNNAAFFVSHRLPIAELALRLGWRVKLYTGSAGSVTLEGPALQQLAAAGVTHQRLAFRSGGVNPLFELVGLLQLAWHLFRDRPDVLHCASPKGLYYGGIAARLAAVPAVVLAVSGMGYALTAGKASFQRRLLGGLSRLLARLAYGHTNKRVIVQNRDDERILLESKLADAKELLLIPGSGVDLQRYRDVQAADKEPLVVLPARLLVDKGVVEFAQAAKLLRAQGCTWTFVLAGTADYQNPSAVPVATIEAWVREGPLQWWGHVDDMVPVYARASIVCLPSYYREGLPKCLLEAAAAGCAVITADSIGCREAIVPGVTGDLVPVRDSAALAKTLQLLIEDKPRLLHYGQAGRALAIERYSLDAVLHRTFAAYRELIEDV